MKNITIKIVFLIFTLNLAMAKNSFLLESKNILKNYTSYTYRVDANFITYEIFILSPTKLSNKKPLPVVYMLDGNKQFPIASREVQATDQQVILVGIGYKNDSDDYNEYSHSKAYGL